MFQYAFQVFTVIPHQRIDIINLLDWFCYYCILEIQIAVGWDVKATLQHYAFVFIVFNTFQYLFVMSDYVIRIDCQTEKEEEKIMLLIEVELGLFNL